MFYRLNPRYLLRGWQRLPYGLVDRETGVVSFVYKRHYDAINLATGKIDLNLPVISPEVRESARELVSFGVLEPCERGEGARDPEQEYRFFGNRFIQCAHWSITGKCNFRCKHCFMSAPDAKFGEISHEQALDVIDQLADCGIYQVELTGGEPLIRSDFMELVDALRAKGIHITNIYTNGALVTDELLDELEARGVRCAFTLSFDGVGWHDWMRGIPGAEAMARKAFERCRAHGFPTAAAMVIFDKNKDVLRETVRELGKLGVNSLKTNPVATAGEWVEHEDDGTLTMDEMYQIYLDYIPQYYEDGLPLQFLDLGGFFNVSRQRPEQFWVPVEHHCEDPKRTCLCSSVRNQVYISADGQALPCMALAGSDDVAREDFPNIFDIGLKACLTDSHYMKCIDYRVSDFAAANPECAECEYLLSCIGGCRGAALDEDPTFYLGPDHATCGIFKGGWIPRINEVASAASERYLAGVGAKE